MTKTEINIPLLKHLRTRFLRMRHVERFNMEDYARTTERGTAMCIAGHALDLQGYKIRGKGSLLDGEVQFISPTGRKVAPFTTARREMGLSLMEATDLFTDMKLKTPQQAAVRIQRLIDSVEQSQ